MYVMGGISTFYQCKFSVVMKIMAVKKTDALQRFSHLQQNLL
jgi:hypothetical protein